MQFDENTELEGFHYIPGKVHADVIEGLIGALYLETKDLNDCQKLLYHLDVLRQPNLKIDFDESKISFEGYDLPKVYSDF